MLKNKKLLIFKSIWIFIIGCIIGYVCETIFYILKYHQYVNKQGLLYGPFKPIYGFGALLFTFIYHLLKNKSSLNIFMSGLIIGGLFEYLASIILEYFFNSYFWDYSTFKYNINGRVYVPYAIAWGILALIWIKIIYLPLEKKYHQYIEKKWFKIISLIMTVLMTFNILLTGIVLIRQGNRDKSNFVFKIVDQIYSEKEIKRKFPKFRPLS